MEESKRGSGRTTRMLREALAEAALGRVVIVLGWRDIHCAHMLRMMCSLPEVRQMSINTNFSHREIVVGTGRVQFRSVSAGGFDWKSRTFFGRDPRIKVFIDHHTWETRVAEERERALNAARTAKMAAGGPTNPAHPRVLPGAVARDTAVADSGTPETVSLDVSGDAPSSCSWSDGGSGPCGAD